MKKRKPLKGLHVVFIGDGNVATHLSAEFSDAGATVLQKIRRTASASSKFAKNPTATLKKLNIEADLYILAVPDDAIPAIVKAMPVVKGIVVHTSGSVPMNALKKFPAHGVFYPLQSFTKGRKLTVNSYAICLEGSTKQVTEDLMECAGGISKNAYLLNSEQRERVHLAAVFANNFSNYMFAAADQLLEEKDLPFELLQPLILETAFKVLDNDPATAQTGPAKRNDKKTMARHLAMLKKNPDLAKLYKKISKHIRS